MPHLLLLIPTTSDRTRDFLEAAQRLGVEVACFAIWLATRIGWLVAGGWTPAWGAFTFPTVALAGAAMIFFDRVAGGALSVLGWPFLLGCSATVLVVLGGAIEAVVTGRRYF